MLTLIAALLIGQATVPTAHPSTWDGVPGSETVRTDPETGEITYPMGQQPPDALALGCVFGRSNVRCPKPIDVEAQQAEADAAFEAWRASGATDEAKPVMAQAPTDETDGSDLTDGFDDLFEPSDFETLQREVAAERQRRRQPEAQSPRAQAGCRREERRSADGSSTTVQMVCGSGDQDLMDDVMERLRPH